MKVFLISTYGVGCGIAKYTNDLSQFLAKRYAVKVLSEYRDKATNDVLWSSFEECWRRIGEYWKLFYYIKENKPDIVHVQHEFGLHKNDKLLLSLLQDIKSQGIKTGITLHTVFPVTRMEHAYFHQNLHLVVDFIIVHHVSAQEELYKWNGSCGNIVVIPHGTRMGKKQSRKSAREKLGLPQKSIISLTLGYISPDHKQLETSKLIMKLVQQGLLRDYIHVIVGEPGRNIPPNIEYMRRIIGEIKGNKAEDIIKIIPKYVPEKDLGLYYGAADFIINRCDQTFFSTSGRAHTEMGFQMPAIVSDERFMFDYRGRSIQFSSINELRDAILLLAQDKKLRVRLSKLVKEYAIETSWFNTVQKHIRVYQ